MLPWLAEGNSRPQTVASDGNRVRLVLVSKVAGVRQAREDVITRQPRIVREDGGFRLTGGEQLQNELHRQPGPADDRLTRQDLGLDHDALGPGHALIIHPEAVEDVLTLVSSKMSLNGGPDSHTR